MTYLQVYDTPLGFSISFASNSNRRHRGYEHPLSPVVIREPKVSACLLGVSRSRRAPGLLAALRRRLTSCSGRRYDLAVSRDLRAIVFDLDGVLADSEGLHLQAWERLFAGRGLPFDPRWAMEWVGVPDVEIAARVARQFSTQTGAGGLVSEKRERFRGLVREGLRSFEGVAAELGLCAAGSLLLGVGTSSARAEASLMLQVMGFERFLPVVVAGDDVPRVKPAPDIYLEAARLLEVPPQQCIALEDSPLGITAARAAGMAVAGVSTSFPPERLGEAERVFALPAEAIRWLRGIVRPRN